MERGGIRSCGNKSENEANPSSEMPGKEFIKISKAVSFYLELANPWAIRPCVTDTHSSLEREIVFCSARRSITPFA
jgi:hypothetical protein